MPCPHYDIKILQFSNHQSAVLDTVDHHMCFQSSVRCCGKEKAMELPACP